MKGGSHQVLDATTIVGYLRIENIVVNVTIITMIAIKENTRGLVVVIRITKRNPGQELLGTIILALLGEQIIVQNMVARTADVIVRNQGTINSSLVDKLTTTSLK